MLKARPRPLVLVVEDIDWIREGMAAQLRARGYDVAEAADADAALPDPFDVLDDENERTWAVIEHGRFHLVGLKFGAVRGKL